MDEERKWNKGEKYEGRKNEEMEKEIWKELEEDFNLREYVKIR